MYIADIVLLLFFQRHKCLHGRMHLEVGVNIMAADLSLHNLTDK